MRAAICFVLLAACGSSSHSTKDAGEDAPLVDAGADASCFTNPTTHYEIINACTTADKIYKPGKPPLENADGSLPPLP
jgi:hypothetical protein